MKFGAPTSRAPRLFTAGFTLAEVLAALLFMAIVIPAAIEGMHIASLAGTVAARKGEAARVAQRLLTETLITTNWNQSAQSAALAWRGKVLAMSSRIAAIPPPLVAAPVAIWRPQSHTERVLLW